ncbi:MAG: NAD(P)-dependent oxidoreductase [Sulfuricaulis sp.]|nr:NAD(P)-dependent oxidoreductase [Sulfuricaulis sp.]
MKLAIGFIGLGDIGAPMATRILMGGFDLVVWNRTASKMDPLVAAGATVARSAADLARRCDIVCLCVDSPQAIEEIVFGLDGVVAGAGRARLLLDNSTTHPQRTREMAQRLKEMTSMAWLDVPVSGGPVGARAGTLAAMAGGDAADLDFARPIIMSYANRVTLMGSVGCGQATKACNQVINFGTIAALAEALTLGERYGLDVSRLPEALSGGFADSNIMKEYDRCVTNNDFTGIGLLVRALGMLYQGDIHPALGGKLGLLMKDIGIALELGHHTSSAMPLMGLLDAQFRVIHNHKPVRTEPDSRP